jgi:PAS domain S-box-containing protein
MHRLLERQIKYNLGKDFHFATLDDKILNLLKTVSLTYEDNDSERKFLEHTININTEELNTLLRERSSLLDSRTQENQDVINLLHQYKNAIDASLIVSTTDLNGIIKYANENFCKTSGYSKDELIGRSHNIIKNPDNDISLFQNIWNTIKSKQIWNGIISNVKKNGDKFYLNMTIIPLLDIEQEIKEFICLCEDITKQIIYQEELKSQRERISTIFNYQENIVIIVDEKNGIVEANKRFFETFNFKDLSDYKNSVNNISYLFDVSEKYFNFQFTESEWFKQFFEKTEFLHKISRTDTRGNKQIFSMHCRNVVLNNKPHYLSTLVDITELENAREKSEIAQKAKSTFLANMSHEIRTPLSAIIGFSEILCESDMNIENKENVKIISRSAKSLLSIINDVLDLSKIESGKLDIFNESSLFEPFIEHIVELFSVASREKDIKFIYSPDIVLPYTLIFDSTRLQQVISNLLSNAIKFTANNGEIVFSVKILKRLDNKVKIRFSIKDTGIGMSQEQQNIVFNPFSQADDGISRKYGGTGLGLAICNDIIKLMNSEIELISNQNEGSEFSFNLDFEVDKFENEKRIINNDFKFLLYCSEKNNDKLRSNIENHINKLGQISEYTQSNNNGNILFCCGNNNLEYVLEDFKKNNKESFVIYVGDKNNISEYNAKNYINYYLNLPIYGSKLFNIISENLKLNSIVINKPSLDVEKFEGKVLVAEDNPNNQKLIEILLNKLGLKSTITSNGAEAVAVYKKERFDLILMDINMPIMDGISATKEIRDFEKDKNYNIPIIALTANSIVGDKEKYLSEGMDDYLSKPIEFALLVNILKRYLKFNSSEDLISNKINSISISTKLQVPVAIGEILFSSFKEEILKDLEELNSLIEVFDANKIVNKIYYIKNSCLNIDLLLAINILEKMENQFLYSKNDLISEFNKLNKTILYACDL